MNADDRTLLLDLENLGTRWLRPRPCRARLQALLSAAGPVHHVVAAYAAAPNTDDGPLASLLAELRVAPLRVLPGADAAELALLAHARRVHTAGGRSFLVGSADGRFSELAALGRVELLVWDGQPVAVRLADVVHHIHRLPRPTGTADDDPPDRTPDPDTSPPSEARPLPPRTRRPVARRGGYRCRRRHRETRSPPSFSGDCSAGRGRPVVSLAWHPSRPSRGTPHGLRSGMSDDI